MGVSNRTTQIAVNFGTHYLTKFFAFCSCLAENNRNSSILWYVIDADVDRAKCKFIRKFLAKYFLYRFNLPNFKKVFLFLSQERGAMAHKIYFKNYV